MGYEQVRFLAPVKPGDTLYAETEIVEARATSKPSRGIIKFKDVAKNQRGEVVMEALRTMLVEQVT
jgi:itaconyl-CoA hydratase